MKINLSEDWAIRYEKLGWGPEMAPAVLNRSEGWMKGNLPCDIHMPLLENGLITEPLEGENSFACEWTEEKSWWFRKDFILDEECLQQDVVELVLESLDAEADIFLNGIHLAHHKSAFYAFEQDVKRTIQSGINVLLVRVTSGLEHYSEQDINDLKRCVSAEGVHHRGDARRIFVRKPQYGYGWDWGPRVATCGIMKGAFLRGYTKVAIRSVHGATRSIGKDAQVDFEVEIENLHSFSTHEAILHLGMSLKGKSIVDKEQEVFLNSGTNFVTFSVTVPNAQLWWPNGIGIAHLYTVSVSAVSEDAIIDYPSFAFGIRTLELDQTRLQDQERMFTFVVNGVNIFCKGGNWIPADSIYARVTDEKYDVLIKEARNANFNMLRIWGGGIYERDIFYEKCDEYGILLWHDFMFSCAMYPDDQEWFRNEVSKELNYQTRRLRNHASLALFSGNNENTWGFDEWWPDSMTDAFKGGAICYNKIAPHIVRQNCPEIPYWNSSPYGGEHPNGNDAGDRHHWHDCTMNPDMMKRITPEEYDKVTAKFVSEYGYIGPCRKSSILQYHGGAPLDKDGPIWKIHNNTFEKETVPAGIRKHYADPEGLELDEYLLYAGLCQGLMLGYSLEAIRYKTFCSGSLFWMYNDCWGEVGWTIIDYYLKRKPSFYAVKRAFAPIKLILREENGLVGVMGINETDCAKETVFEYGMVSFDGLIRKTFQTTLILQPYTREVVFQFTKGDQDFTKDIVFIKPIIDTKELLPATLRAADFRKLDIGPAELVVTGFMRIEDRAEFVVKSSTFVHGVHFNLDDGLHLSDEYFDLLPGEMRSVTIFDVPQGFTAADVLPIGVIPVGV